MQDTDLIDECIDMILELEGYDTDEIDNHEFRMPDINIDKKRKTKKKLIPVLIVIMILVLAISGTTSGVLTDLILMIKNNTLDFPENDISYQFKKNVVYYYDLDSLYKNEDYDITLTFVPEDYILQSIICFNNINPVIEIKYILDDYYINITIINYYSGYFYKVSKGASYSNIFLYYNNYFYNIECNNNILNEIVKFIELLGD